MRLAFRDPHPHAVALRAEGNKNHKALRRPRQAVPAKDHLFDGDLNDIPRAKAQEQNLRSS